MRRTIAAFLLVCLGMIIPLAGGPVRFCLLDHRVLVPGTECSGENPKKDSCCEHQKDKDHPKGPCCLKVDELPDATTPSAPDVLPPLLVMDLPEPIFTVPPYVELCDPVFAADRPIRGPDTPAARRAVLGVWRL